MLIVRNNIDLNSTNSRTAPVLVPDGATKAAIDVAVDTVTYGWASAVLSIQDSNGVGLDAQGRSQENFATRSPAVTFSSGTVHRRNVSVTPGALITLRVTTAAASTGGDPSAEVTWLFSP